MRCGASSAAGDQAALIALIRAIGARDLVAAKLLDAAPGLAGEALVVGASRAEAAAWYFPAIEHYAYAGDTALHLAAAAYDAVLAARLIASGADPAARNRRGASPLHYAAEGHPSGPTWRPDAQAATIRALIDAGAPVDGEDIAGVTPLHRAIRTRCAAAVEALLASGADAHKPNGKGTTPLELAHATTGRGGSGSDAAKREQQAILALLQARSSSPTGPTKRANRSRR